MPERIQVLAVVAFTAWAAAAWAAEDAQKHVDQQRQWFLDAREALQAGDDARFARLKARLRDYPLYPYLEIWRARRALELRKDDDWVEAALAKYADIPEAADLRLAWIKSLAERGQWPHVAEQLSLQPGAASMFPEIAMATMWWTGRREQALAVFGERWRRGANHSEITHALEQAWMRSGHPTIQERWARIITLAKQQRWQEVNELTSALSAEQQAWLRQWRQGQREPQAILSHWPDISDPVIAGAMFADILHRLASQDVRLAWRALRHHRRLAGEAYDMYRKRIALKAAKEHLPQAADWLAELPPRIQDDATRAWQARLYLLRHDDRRALAVIRAMPAKQQELSRWRFWKAVMLRRLGRKADAKRLFAKLAEERGFYSFLSAEILGKPYHLAASDLAYDPAVRQAIARHPAMRRAYEWWVLGEAGKADREWYLAMRSAGAEQWKAAAALAREWGWHDRAIYAVYRAGEMDALAYRFPKGFADVVDRYAKATGLSRSLIWSVIRQESAFNPHAISRAGARGLMQLMPSTAREVAKKHHLDAAALELFDAATNIHLGSLYLSELAERFGGNPALIAAAYNAGPTRVSRWLKHTPIGDSVEDWAAWIEAIPFTQTRRYVQHVLAFMIVYDWMQQQPRRALSSYLVSLEPRAGSSLD